MGVGKTFTAMSVVDHMITNNPGLNPIIVHSASEFKKVLDITENLIVIVDDFGGDVFIDETDLLDWSENSNLLSVCLKDKKFYIVFTARNDVIEKIKEDNVRLKSIIYDDVINFDDMENALTKSEKADICMKYAKFKDLPLDKKSVDFLDCTNETTVGFPLLCRLMSRNNIKKVFENPAGTVENQISQVSQQAKSHFIVLILTFLFEDYLPKAELSDYQNMCYDKILSLVKIRKNYEKITDTAEGLLGTVLKYNKHSEFYKFIHPVLFQEIMRWFWNHQREDFMELCPLKCFSCMNIRNTDFEIEVDYTGAPYLEPEYYTSVLDRLKYEVETRKTEVMEQVASLKLWNYDNFIQQSIQKLQFEFFFIKDKTNVCLFVYFAQLGKCSIIKKVVEYIKARADISVFKADVQKSLELACRNGFIEVVKLLIDLCDSVSDAAVVASAEGGDVEIIKILATKVYKLSDITSEDGLNLIQLACMHGHKKLVKYLYTHMKDSLFMRDSKGRSLLHQAVVGGSKGILKFFLSNSETFDADLLIRTKTGTTLLHTACEEGRLGVVKYLCKLYPSMILSVDQDGLRPADHAVINGHVDCLKFLISQRNDSDEISTASSLKGKISEGRTKLHLACLAGQSEMVKFLCKTFPDMIKSENNESLLPVHDAIIGEHTDILDYLITNGHGPMVFTSDGRTILHIAAFEGKLQVVQHICSKYPTLLKVCDSDGNTVAHDASASGQLDVLKYLLEKGIDPKSRNYDGCSILHDAAYFGRLEMARYLCKQYPDMMKIVSNTGYTVGHAAALGGSVEVLKLLIESNCNQNIVSQDQSTLLHEAAYSGQLQMVQFLCSVYPEMVNARTKNSFTACHYAVQEGHETVVTYFLGEMCDANILTSDGETLLHVAAYNGQLGLVKYLCKEFPGLLEMVDISGGTVLHAAARGGDIDTMSYLLEQDLDPFVITENGSTLLHLAAYDGRLEIIKFLCGKFPNMIPVTDSTGHSPGHYAAGSGNVEVFKYLLSKDIDPMAQTANGSSCLLKAAYTGKLEMVEYLTETFPELLIMDDQFKCTAAHYSACEGHVDVLKYLLSKGISPLLQTVDGHTILHIAAFHGRAEVVAFLCKAYPDLIPVEDIAGQTVFTFAESGGHQNIMEYLRKNVKRKYRSQSKNASRDRNEGNTLLQRLHDCWSVVWQRVQNLLCCCRNK